MNRLLTRLHDIGVIAWVRFVQALNWIMVSVLASVAVVNETYPGVISNAVGKMPPWLGIPAILIFGLLVHYALRRAAKAA